MPLAARGLGSAGIDLSPDMVASCGEDGREPGRDRGHGDDDESTERSRSPTSSSTRSTTSRRRTGRSRPSPTRRRTSSRAAASSSRSACRTRGRSRSSTSATRSRSRRARLRNAAARLPPLLARRRRVAQTVRAVPLGLAGGARPDGAAGRDGAARALGGLGPLAVHRREHEARLGMGEELSIELPIETDRLVMRALCIEDAGDLRESEEWIQEKIDRFERDGGMSLWAAVERESGGARRTRRSAVGGDRRAPRARSRLRRRGRGRAARLRDGGVGGDRERGIRGRLRLHHRR